MERGEKPVKPIRIEIGDDKFELLPTNTAAVIHPEEYEAYDCIIHVPETGPALAIFRENISNGFDDLIETMLHTGFDVAVDDTPSSFSKEIYLNIFGRDPQHKTDIVESNLTQRQERRVKFLRYILQKELLVPKDFDGDGELYI